MRRPHRGVTKCHEVGRAPPARDALDEARREPLPGSADVPSSMSGPTPAETSERHPSGSPPGAPASPVRVSDSAPLEVVRERPRATCGRLADTRSRTQANRCRGSVGRGARPETSQSFPGPDDDPIEGVRQGRRTRSEDILTHPSADESPPRPRRRSEQMFPTSERARRCRVCRRIVDARRRAPAKIVTLVANVAGRPSSVGRALTGVASDTSPAASGGPHRGRRAQAAGTRPAEASRRLAAVSRPDRRPAAARRRRGRRFATVPLAFLVVETALSLYSVRARRLGWRFAPGPVHEAGTSCQTAQPCWFAIFLYMVAQGLPRGVFLVQRSRMYKL